MKKPETHPCGCCGTGGQRELRHLIDMLERQQQEKKEAGADRSAPLPDHRSGEGDSGPSTHPATRR